MQERQVPLDVFVGRVAELAQVAEVAALAATGQPWLVSIHGDPGTGKTSLARLWTFQLCGRDAED